MVFSLAQIPAKSIVMDVIVAHIPTIFGMFLSISWGMKLRGSIKLYLTYETIHVFGGEERILYKESKFVKIVTRRLIKITPLYILIHVTIEYTSWLVEKKKMVF